MKSILINLLLLSHLFLVSHSIGNGFFILKDLNCDNFNLLKVKRIFFFFYPSKILTWYWGSARISLIPTSGSTNWLLEVRGMKIGTRWFARQNHLLFRWNLKYGLDFSYFMGCGRNLGQTCQLFRDFEFWVWVTSLIFTFLRKIKGDKLSFYYLWPITQ